MTARAQHLLNAQASRFAAMDPMLPGTPAPPDGDALTAALDDGHRVAGVLVPATHSENELASLWQALEVYELHPMLGDTGAAGMDALLRAWRQWLDRTRSPGPDSACMLSWPSRDVAATRVLLDHGMMPLSVLAVRTATPVRPEPSPVVVRRATPRDLDAVLELAMDELRYSSQVGPTSMRPRARELKRGMFERRLALGEPMWLAERDGVPTGLTDCTLSDVDTGSLVPPGRWGYVNTVSVAAGARGTGTGRRMMDQVHAELHRLGATGTYLYYNPANPLSPVFWSKQGYRPLWTIWEVRPAGALR